MKQYIIPAIRHFKKNKFSLLLNLISLILGFLVCFAIILNAWQQFSTDHFIPDSERIFRLNCGGYGVTPPCFKDLIGSKIPEIEASARLNARDLEIVLKNEATTISRVCCIDENFIKMFGIELIAGDPKTVLKDPFNLVLSESTAIKIFGTSHASGKTLIHNKRFVFTITGIMKDLPTNSHLKINGLIAIQTLPIISEHNEKLDDCGSWSQLTYLLLGKTTQKADCEKKINILLEDHKMGTRDGKLPLWLEPVRSIYFDGENNKFDASVHGNLLVILSFLALGILTLFMACINSINYSLAQSEQRFKEIQVMRIYGASRTHISYKILVEMMLLFQISGIVASALLEISLPFFSKQIGFEAGFLQNRTEFYMLCFGISTALGLIAGIFPIVYQNSRMAFLNTKISVLHSKRKHKAILMILMQYTLTTLFITSMFIVIGQIDFMRNKNPGFRPENILQVDLDQNLSKSYNYLKNKISIVDGVEKLAFSDTWIGEGFGKKPTGEKGQEIICNFFSIDPDYIDVMGIAIKEGRNFSWNNPSDTSTAIIMNETAARAFDLNSGNGRIFNSRILVGITQDFNFFSFKNEIEPFIIIGLKGNPRIMSIRLHTGHEKETREKIIKICKEISPDFHNRISLVTESLQNYYSTEINLSKGIMIYATIAFILSVLGIIGICAIRLQKRRKEMAIRKILGAAVVRIMGLVLWDFLPWVFLANLLSIPITIYLSRIWLRSYAYHESLSSVPFIASALISIGITGIIIVIITSNSCRENPAGVLHEE